GAVAEEGGGAKFTVFHDQALRPHGQNLFGGANEIRVARQQMGFAVVDQQGVKSLEHAGQVFGLAIDPEVHGVAADELGAGHFGAHLGLKHRIDVGEEEVVRVLILDGNPRLKALE